MLLGQVVLLFSLTYRAIGDGQYFLAHDDEVINYCSAILFDETGSVRAEGSINEDVSRVGQMNWYGPGYTIFYGSLRAIFGDAPYLFVWINLVLAMLTLGLVYFQNGNSENKLRMTNALAFTWQFSAYIFTYFPETLNLLVAMVLVLLLLRLNETNDLKSRSKIILIYFTVVLIFILCRVTFVFWLVALVGVSGSRKEAIRMFFLFAITLVVVLLYMKYFTAPPYAGEMQKIDKLYQFSILEFILKTGWALMRNTYYLLVSGSVEVYGLLLLMAVVALRWWKTKERILLAALLVSVTVIAALLAFYSPGPSYFLKQSDTLLPLLLAALMFSPSPSPVKSGVVLAALLIFMFSIQGIWGLIQERRVSFERFTSNAALHASLQELPAYMDEAYPVTVLWCYNEFPFGNITEALLPFSTKSQKPILYTSSVVDPSSKPEVKFQRYGKLQIDYLLSREPVTMSWIQEVHATEFYHLYKIIDNKK